MFRTLTSLTISFIGLCVFSACQSKATGNQSSDNKINLRAKVDVSTYFDILKKDLPELAEAHIKDQNLSIGWVTYLITKPLPKLFVPAKKNIGIPREFGEVHLYRGYDNDVVFVASYKCAKDCEQNIKIFQFEYDGKYRSMNFPEVIDTAGAQKFTENYQKCIQSGTEAVAPHSVSCPMWLVLSREGNKIGVYLAAKNKIKTGDKLKQKLTMNWSKKAFLIEDLESELIWTERAF